MKKILAIVIILLLSASFSQAKIQHGSIIKKRHKPTAKYTAQKRFKPTGAKGSYHFTKRGKLVFTPGLVK